MSKLHTNRQYVRLTALVLAVCLLFTLFANNAHNFLISVSAQDDVPYVMTNGERVEQLTIRENDRYLFHAVSEKTYTGYRWQIADPTDPTRFVDISGSNTSALWVTYALVGSMMDDSGYAYLRCRLLQGDETVYTDPVKVSVSANVLGYGVNPRYAHAGSAAAPMPAAEEDDRFKTCTIVINYLFDDNTIAFEPYGAEVPKGEPFYTKVSSPFIVGFDPYRRVDGEYVRADEVVIDVQSVDEDMTINIVYEPGMVEFTVQHHLQNLLDDEYTLDRALTYKKEALTNSLVGEGLALTEQQLPGFTSLIYDEQLTVAADKSTVVEIRYDRNYYLIDFDMADGYGTEPVYTRYGATVGANTPTRHGYVFDGWELVSYNGNAPTLEQASQYAIGATKTIVVPNANLKYRAKWVANATEYTLVFWKENTNDNGYSYWGYLTQPAVSGEYVSGSDMISKVSGIDDEAYFNFNAQKTEKDVLVEGDGSTVVNVYYTRKMYDITFKAKAKCTIPEKHTHTDDCYDLICGLKHIHTDDCGAELSCGKNEHTAHTADCITCAKEEHLHGGVGCDCQVEQHTHVPACWGTSVGSQVNKPNRAPSAPEDGYIHRSGFSYYIYIKGSWYVYSGGKVSSGAIKDPSCQKEEHTHGSDCKCSEPEHLHVDGCYIDTLHTHDKDCYTYHCNEVSHTHTAECQRLKCGIPTGHSHTSTCNNTTGVSTVKIVRRKYQQSIADLWPVSVPENNKVYDGGERWEPSDSSYYDAVLVYLSQMPPDDFTLTLNEASYNPYTMNYYLQVLDGDPYTTEYNGKRYILENTLKAKYNYVTREEDFFNIIGFKQSVSNPSFGSNGQISISGTNRNVDFYYDRVTDKYLTFSNNGEVVKSVTGIMYGASLTSQYFEPAYPSNLEPNAYAFAGWYTSPGCFAGTEVNWESLTMPEDGLMLYAKWAPITHTVRVYKDATLKEQIGETQIVDHKAFAKDPNETVTNGNYVFQGWFYKTIEDGKEVEKAFVFGSIPIIKDMQIYAKWSSHISVNYTIHYVLEGTDTKVANSVSGYTIAGNNMTFYAKAGDELFPNYREGYYPNIASHTVTMDADSREHVFVFEYAFVESVPYKVQYLDATSGEKLLPDKVMLENGLSVVTETFEPIAKKMPDAYQKRLVLSAEGIEPDENGIFKENVITFYYHIDEVNAYYRTVHYIQNISGDGYREYRSEDLVGEIGKTHTVQALNLTGFSFKGDKTKVNSIVTPVPGNTVSAIVGENGVLIELYYDRIEVGYITRYLAVDTGEEIVSSVEGVGLFGEQVMQYPKDLSAYGYDTVVGTSARTITLAANAEYNVIEFYYQEKNVSIKYQLVGPQGCGRLTPYSEPLAAVNGQPGGSTPTVNDGFAFVGWYTDAACTKPVDASMVHPTTNKLTPTKTGVAWKDVTYYAKFIALQTDLTIRVNSTYASDTDQGYLFRLVGKAGTTTADVDLAVSVVGNNAVTIRDLPTGEYTLTELTDWSWRYENAQSERDLQLEYNNGSNTVTFQNTRPHALYLDGNAVADNLFR